MLMIYVRNASAVVTACVALSGCLGTTAKNADVPRGIYTGLEAKPDVAPVSGVRIVDGSAPAGGQTLSVSGLSCKNKIWQPEPSEANAVALMKRQAQAAGYIAVGSVKIDKGGTSLVTNCWSTVTATGTAFTA